MSVDVNNNLDNYKSYPNTKSCYLDGRYFNKVFSNYPGLIKEPLNIVIKQDKITKKLKYQDYMKHIFINNNYPGLLRVIIDTPLGRHSSFVIIDYKGGNIFRFDPYGRQSPYFNQVNNIIEKYLDLYLDFDMYIIENIRYDQKNPTCVANGIEGGFCVAYVIKYAYDYLNNRNYDPSDILKFASAIEHKYGPLSDEDKDIEYGLFGNNNPNQGRNAMIGGIGGAVTGGLLTGSPGGMLLGGIGGGLLGSML